MSEEQIHHEGPPGDSNTPPVYTPEQWFADWSAFQGARLDTAEEQRDWILLHFAGKYPVSEELDRMERLMKALLWVRENREDVCRVAPWVPGTQMPKILIQVLYAMFGSGLLDDAPRPTKQEIPDIFDLVRGGGIV